MFLPNERGRSLLKYTLSILPSFTLLRAIQTVSSKFAVHSSIGQTMLGFVSDTRMEIPSTSSRKKKDLEEENALLRKTLTEVEKYCHELEQSEAILTERITELKCQLEQERRNRGDDQKIGPETPNSTMQLSNNESNGGFEVKHEELPDSLCHPSASSTQTLLEENTKLKKVYL